MRSRQPIRPDVHARFVALVARADSVVEDEQRAMQRRLAVALARETREGGRRDPDGDANPQRERGGAASVARCRRQAGSTAGFRT